MDKNREDRNFNTSASKLSESKNPYGVEIRKARLIGVFSTAIFAIAFMMTLSSLISDPSIPGIFLLTITFLLTGTSVKFSLSEKESGKINTQVLQFGENVDSFESYQPNQSTGVTKSVCRECREKISADVKRCPHCGWKPQKRGWLWWGITGLMILNPIGLIMGAKGASDKVNANKGVAEEVSISSNESTSESTGEAQKTPSEKLKRINELRNEEVITEEEFQAKKEELLEEI
jgi:RNA polymerase subunit RPABC4/transcription elongation factor Spt4